MLKLKQEAEPEPVLRKACQTTSSTGFCEQRLPCLPCISCLSCPPCPPCPQPCELLPYKSTTAGRSRAQLTCQFWYTRLQAERDPVRPGYSSQMRPSVLKLHRVGGLYGKLLSRSNDVKVVGVAAGGYFGKRHGKRRGQIGRRHRTPVMIGRRWGRDGGSDDALRKS